MNNYNDNRTHSEHADWQGKVMRDARLKSDISIIKMAECMSTSDKTIRNWENGVSSPTITQAYAWFKITDVNPMYAIQSYIYPYLFQSDMTKKNDDEIAKTLSLSIDTLPLHEKRILIYILKGSHGSDPIAIIQEMAANVHTPLYDRNTIATLVRDNYDIALNMGTIINPDNVKPNLSILDRAINRSTISLHAGKSGYSIAQEEYDINKDISEYNKWIGIVIRDARLFRNISTTQMAREMDITERTLYKWENGSCSFNLKDLFKWFRIAKINPAYAFLTFTYPSAFEKTDKNIFDTDKDIDNELIECIEKLKPHEKRIILFILTGMHGSSSISILQEIIANLQTPLRDRYIVARIIQRNYSIANSTHKMVCPNNVQPNMDIFTTAIENSKQSLLTGKNYYYQI